MKKGISPDILPEFTLFTGILALLLQIWLRWTGVDAKGLLLPFRIPEILLWLLTVGVIVVLLLAVRRLNGLPRRVFPASIPGSVGCFAAAVGIGITGVSMLLTLDRLNCVTGVFALLSAGCLVLLGLLRWKGRPSAVLPHIVLTVFFLLHLVCQYRQWNRATQLQTYLFPLLSSVFLMLAGYQSCMLNIRTGSRKGYAFCTQAAAFFACGAIVWSDSIFYAAAAIWSLTNLCSLAPNARKGNRK